MISPRTFVMEMVRQGWCLVVGHESVPEYSTTQQKTIQRCLRCRAWTEYPW